MPVVTPSLVLLLMLSVVRTASAYDPPLLDPQKSGGHARKDAALVIAAEDYASIPDATFAKADADAFTGFLTGNADVPAGNVVRLDNPSAAEIRTALVALKGRVKKNGTVWLYFAGHGGIVRVDLQAQSVLLPSLRPQRSGTCQISWAGRSQRLRLCAQRNAPAAGSLVKLRV